MPGADLWPIPGLLRCRRDAVGEGSGRDDTSGSCCPECLGELRSNAASGRRLDDKFDRRGVVQRLRLTELCQQLDGAGVLTHDERVELVDPFASRAGRQAFEQRFDAGRMANDYVVVYRRIIAAG